MSIKQRLILLRNIWSLLWYWRRHGVQGSAWPFEGSTKEDKRDITAYVLAATYFHTYQRQSIYVSHKTLSKYTVR